MKCAEKNCRREASPGNRHCSELCARFDSPESAEPSSRARTETFSTIPDGERSPASSGEKPRTELAPSPYVPSVQKPLIVATTPIQKKVEPISEKSSSADIGKPQKNPEGKQMTERNEMIQLKSSEASLPLFAEEKSQSQSLLVDSVKHLHGLMKSVAVGLQTPEGGNSKLDPQSINAAANCAKQMGALMKLQLEHDKMTREKA